MKSTSPPAFTFTENTAFGRKKSPTEVSPEGKLDLPERSRYRRHLETLLAATEIHGGSVENRQPALDGIFSTLDKYASVQCLEKYLGAKKIRKATVNLVQKDVKKFEESQENVTRSFSLLYAGGLVSKRKYQETRSALGTPYLGIKTERVIFKGRELSLVLVYLFLQYFHASS